MIKNVKHFVRACIKKEMHTGWRVLLCVLPFFAPFALSLLCYEAHISRSAVQGGCRHYPFYSVAVIEGTNKSR